MDSTLAPYAISPAPAPAPDDDPRIAMEEALTGAGSVIQALRPDQLDAATPYEGLDVRALADHLIDALRRLAAIGREGDPRRVPLLHFDGAGAWHRAWRAAARDVVGAWADDSILGRPLELPEAVLPGSIALQIVTGEIVGYTLALATATGQLPR